MDNKKLITAIIIVAIIIIGGYFLLSKPVSSEPIKIGYISALSGQAGVWGQSLKKGFDFAVEEINSSGGIKGKKIEIVYEDDACDAAKGMSAFSKVIDVDKIKIITGTVCSSVAMSVTSKTQASRVFYLASGATNPDVPKQGDLVFRNWPSDAYEAKEIGKYAVNSLGLKKTFHHLF